MNWIRKIVFFISLLIIGVFAAQAEGSVVQKIETQKTDTNFGKETPDSSAFIQPQAGYQLAANIKHTNSGVIKWFDSLLLTIPQYRIEKTASNFVNQFSTQSKKILIMLYPFHFFW